MGLLSPMKAFSQGGYFCDHAGMRAREIKAELTENGVASSDKIRVGCFKYSIRVTNMRKAYYLLKTQIVVASFKVLSSNSGKGGLQG